MNERKNRSIVWICSDKDFIELVNKSNSMSELLRYFNLENKGGNFQTCKRRIKHLNLDISHYLNRINSFKSNVKLSLEEFEKRLIEKSLCSRTNIKKYLIKFNLLEYKCSCCQNDGNWQNKKLSLQLEHINGISNDNRLENLTFLCPNCHSQSETYSGKKCRKKYICPSCSKLYAGFGKTCFKCFEKNVPTKINWPSEEELRKLVEEKSLIKISKELRIGHTSLRKHLKKLNIIWKPKGFWQKKI